MRSGPIRVLFTIPNLETAGSGRAMARVIERLDRAVIEPSVCVARPGGALFDEFEEAGVPVVVHPIRVAATPRSTLPIRLRHAALPMRGRYDIWHSYDYRDDYTEALVARFAHARWAFTKKNMSWNHRSWWLRTVLARGIAVQNQDMLRDFFTGPILSRHARYVPRGIPLPPLADPALGRPLRERLGLGADDSLIACVAQIIPRKGQHLLAEAIAELPNVHVALAGAVNFEPYAEKVRASAERAGTTERVHWLGHQSDIVPVLSAADLFCLPTGDMAEGCPVALLEAMGAGVASIATDVPGSRDVVNDERVGRIVPPDDVPALAGAIAELIADPALRRAVAAAGRARVRDTFNLEAEVAAHTALYRYMCR